MTEEKTFLTKEGLEKLKKELQLLKTVKRQEIALRIQDAKELGDLSENAEYTEAKNEQAFVEGRILEIEHMLRSAEMIQEPKSSEIVQVGSKVILKGNNTKLQYMIVGSNEADPTKGLISNESPLGRAFLGKKVGEMIEIKVPRGLVKFQIIKIQ